MEVQRTCMVYFPDANKIKKVRCVRFTEKIIVEPECDIDVYEGGRTDELKEENVQQGFGVQEPEREIDVERNREPETDNSREVRYPTRERSMPKKFDEYVVCKVDNPENVDYCYRVGIVPQSYSEAVRCDESREWQTTMDSEMESLVNNETFEVKELPKGKSVIGGKLEYGRLMNVFWVDDIIVAASSEQLLNHVKTSLSSKFEMKDLCELRWFLGIEFCKHSGCISMSQKQYCQKILTKFGMENCKPRKSPCDEGLFGGDLGHHR